MAAPATPHGSSALDRITEHPRLRDAVVGRLLELLVHSVETARDRVRARID